METLILVCLIIVIILLLKDKVVIYKTVRKQVMQKNRMSDLPDIMGLSKPMERHTVPMNTTKRQCDERSDIPDTFETETYETGFEWENPQREEELDEVFGSMLDFEDEEEEWSEYEYTNSNNEFATGVTFDELTTVGALLQQEVLEPALQQKAADIVQRLQGTELFSLLENSMEGASQRIAALLDKSLSTEADFSSSDLRKYEVGDFDIGEFI